MQQYKHLKSKIRNNFNHPIYGFNICNYKKKYNYYKIKIRYKLKVKILYLFTLISD